MSVAASSPIAAAGASPAESAGLASVAADTNSVDASAVSSTSDATAWSCSGGGTTADDAAADVQARRCWTHGSSCSPSDSDVEVFCGRGWCSVVVNAAAAAVDPVDTDRGRAVCKVNPNGRPGDRTAVVDVCVSRKRSTTNEVEGIGLANTTVIGRCDDNGVDVPVAHGTSHYVILYI